MNAKQIVFTGINKAELLDVEWELPKDYEVTVKMAYTAISSGTERANITGDLNVEASRVPKDNVPRFPRCLGYSGSGVVCEVGSAVTKVKVGDRVVVSGYHKSFCTVHQDMITKIEDEGISLKEAAFGRIATFSLAGLRKTQLEVGESIVIMGLGILGLLAVQFARAAGAYPVIAADPVKERRELAKLLGADYAFDPLQSDFAGQVKAVTGGGANTAIEVTGRGEALDTVLDCMKKHGRISLLGCTRDSDFTIDYYRKVHYPGITLVGAHTMARPGKESYPHYWTHEDDIRTYLKLISGRRINIKPMVMEVHSPHDAQKVYDRLISDKNFPIGVLFDWGQL